jgi:integration host factor subunit beta
MKKSELIRKLHKLYPFLKADQVANLIDITFTELTNSLKQGKRIEIRGFGSFSVKKRKVQSKFRTESEEPISFLEKNAVHFKMGKEFFKRLNSSI